MTLTSRLHIPWHSTNLSAPTATPILPVSLGGPITTLTTLTTTVILLLLAAVVSAHAKPSKTKGKHVPLLNPKRWYELSTARVRREYDADSWNMTRQGMEKYHGEPFRLLTGELHDSEAVVLPTRYAEELKNDKRLSFTALKKKGLHGTLPGFRTMGTLDQANRIGKQLPYSAFFFFLFFSFSFSQ